MSTPKSDGFEIDHKYVDVYGVKMHYVEMGKGPLLVLVHGWNGDWYGFSLLIKELKNFRIIAIDLPGYGDSGRADQMYTIEYMSEMLNEFFKKIDVKPEIVCGLSMGSLVTADFGVRYSKSAESIILLGYPILNYERLTRKLHRRTIAFINSMYITRRLGKTVVANSYYNHMIARLLNMHKYDRKKVNEYVLSGRDKVSPDSVFNIGVSMAYYDSSSALKRLELPTHIIMGKYDKFVDLSSIPRLTKGKKNVSIDWIDLSGHVVSLEKPLETAQSIIKFAKRRKFLK